MINPGRFTGRTAIITGGASGLGLETAKRITAEGGKVSLWDLNAEALAAAKKETGAVHTFAVDVSQPAAVEAGVAESAKALGKMDILINSAGITGATQPVIGYPIDSWLKVMDVNVNGLFYCCRAVAPLMVEAGYGRIVNISSVAGKEGNPNAAVLFHRQGRRAGLHQVPGQRTGDQGRDRQRRHAGHVRKPHPGWRAAKPYRLYALAHSHGPPGYGAGSRGRGLLAGQRGL